MIAHILLLPHAEHRERLLAPGAPVWSPPRDFGWTLFAPDEDGDARSYWYGVADTAWTSGDETHIVLARDGAIVPEGVDRLVRAERAARPSGGWWYGPDLEDALRQIMEGKASGADAAAAFPLGTLLLLDADGRIVETP